MSLTMHRSEPTVDMDFRVGKEAYCPASADENGLATFVKLAGATDHADGIVDVRYGEGIASWNIYSANGHFCLYHIEQGFEGSKPTVASVEDALARIIVTTEAPGPGVCKTGSRHRTGIGHTRGT